MTGRGAAIRIEARRVATGNTDAMRSTRAGAEGIALTSTSAGGYEVHLDGHYIGMVGKVGRIWTARMPDFELGEHKTRREAVEAILDVYSQ